MKSYRSLSGVVILALVVLAGCASDTVTATFDGREADVSSSAAKVLSVRSDEKEAVFQIDDAVVTVSQTQVLWKDCGAALPPGWKRIQLVKSGKSITITVDGKTFPKMEQPS